MANTAPTNYRRQTNRCPRCGHRLEMVPTLNSRRCQVEMGATVERQETITQCSCRQHGRP